MKIQLKFTAQLKKEAGITKDVVELSEGATLQELLRLLNNKYSEGFDKIMFEDDGTFRPSILIVVNDVQVLHTEEYEFSNNDIVTLMSPIAGG